MCAAVDQLVQGETASALARSNHGVLVESLLARAADSDMGESDAAIDRLAAAPADHGMVIGDLWLLRLSALLAQARGDEAGYTEFRDRYRAMAIELGFEGHMGSAEEMS